MAARSTGVNSKVNVYACSLTVSFWCHLLAFRQNIKFCDLNYVFWKEGKKNLSGVSALQTDSSQAPVLCRSHSCFKAELQEHYNHVSRAHTIMSEQHSDR